MFYNNSRAIINPKDGDAVICDASLSEDHIFKYNISKVPVEDGSIKSDHITIEPIRLEMTLLFTDTPVSNFNPLASLKSEEGRARKLFQKVLMFSRNKTILKITTGLQAYSDMAIEELSAPRRSSNGYKVECRVIFSELPVVIRSDPDKAGTLKTTIYEVSHTAVGLTEIGVLT